MVADSLKELLLTCFAGNLGSKGAAEHRLSLHELASELDVDEQLLLNLLPEIRNPYTWLLDGNIILTRGVTSPRLLNLHTNQNTAEMGTRSLSMTC